MASDLLLNAIRYISNELPADEVAAFESRLAHDQAAREAVAEAVELAVAIAALPAPSREILPMQAAPSPSRWLRLRLSRSRLSAVAAGLACAIGLGLYFTRVRTAGPDVPPHRPPVAVVEHPEEVALAWSGLRETGEVDLVSHTELLAWLDEPMASAASTPDFAPSDVSAVEDELLPHWLVEATSLDPAGQSGAGPREN